MSYSLVFDNDTHTYRVDGKVYPSITGLLRESGIIKGSEFGSEEALWRGKVIHKALEFLNKGTLDWDTVDPSVTPYLLAYERFRKDTGFKANTWETPLFHPFLKYCGTYDIEGTVKNENWVIDTKTGLTSRSMSDWVGIQTAAQDLLLGGNIRRKRFGLKLTGEGGYNLIQYTDPNDYAVFMSIITILNWRKNHE